MKTVATRAALRADLTGRPGQRIGFVPTMGALHPGHAALVETARGSSDLVVVSIFVNPLQFGPGEDLDRYPRTLAADLELCRDHGADLVFTPAVDVMYPGGEPEVRVHPGPLGDDLEGAVRPGHFSGVLTVVAKLVNLVSPDLAVFGEKDYQQLVLIRRMVSDLCMPVEVVGVPTAREPDGLARSSRNRYLDADDRASAAVLSRALRAGQEAARDGAQAALGAAREELGRDPSLRLDYLVLRAPDLTAAPDEGDARLLVAAHLGRTRLIDNVPVVLGRHGEG